MRNGECIDPTRPACNTATRLCGCPNGNGNPFTLASVCDDTVNPEGMCKPQGCQPEAVANSPCVDPAAVGLLREDVRGCETYAECAGVGNNCDTNQLPLYGACVQPTCTVDGDCTDPTRPACNSGECGCPNDSVMHCKVRD